MLTISSITNIDVTQNQFIVDGIITPSGNYGTVGGLYPHGDQIVIAATGVSLDQIKSNVAPTKVDLWADYPAGAAMLFDTYKWVNGANVTGSVIQVGVGITEFTPGNPYAGAAPTNIVGFVLRFRAWFPSFAA